MKKVTRLFNYKSKKSKNAKYNPFGGTVGTSKDATATTAATNNDKSLAAIHNYGKTKLKTSATPPTTTTTTTTPTTKNKLKKPKKLQQLQLQSTKLTQSPDVNINYASLNRMRSSDSTISSSARDSKRRKRQRKCYKLQRFLRFNCCWCKTQRGTYNTQRYYNKYCPQQQQQQQQQKPTMQSRKRRCFSCCKFSWRCCRRWRWRSLLCCRKRSSYQYDSDDDDDIDGKFAAYIFEMKQREAAEAAVAAAATSTTALTAATQPQKEAKAAAEELSRSPVLGQRNDPASSPIQSRGSAGSDNWPTQSDEDIDRLVAMHQNRSSLSSLGLRSDSMASVYSGAGEGRYGTVAVKGQVEFGMQYNYKLSALEIHVVRCKDLAAVDVKRNRSDPYVKVYLLPDKSKAGKRKTKVKKHTLNPIFDEVLRFHMPIASLESRTLWLTVWHSDMFGRNDFLGEVSVNLQGKVFDNPQSQLYTLQERSEPFDEVATNRGDIVVGLKFIPPENIKPGFMRGSSITGSSSNLRKFGSIKSVASKSDRSTKGGQLHVLVKEAKNLSPIKANGTCDAFCKSYLLPDRTRSSKQKTPVVKRSLHPTWNYTFVYEDVSLDDLSERALELTVWDHDRLASNEFLGGVRFSLGTGKSYGRQSEWMDASGKELSLWQNMIDRPNFWVEGSLVLRSTLDGIRSIP